MANTSRPITIMEGPRLLTDRPGKALGELGYTFDLTPTLGGI